MTPAEKKGFIIGSFLADLQHKVFEIIVIVACVRYLGWW